MEPTDWKVFSLCQKVTLYGTQLLRMRVRLSSLKSSADVNKSEPKLKIETLKDF
jgi:hypothetical protein